MKTKLMVIGGVLLLAAVAFAGDAPWFDMKNCGFCKHLLDDPEMLEHCTWENHKISNGMITVSTVDDEYLESYRTALRKMEETGKKMQEGEMVPMCGMCQAMGALMMSGATYEAGDTKHGSFSLLTSDDPEVVKKIHAFVDRTNEEMAMMEEHQKLDEDEE